MKFATISNRSGATPSTCRRSMSRRWSTAVTSSNIVNCCSSRRNMAASAHWARSRYTTGWQCDSWKTAPSKCSSSAAATGSATTGTSASTLCSSSRGASSGIAGSLEIRLRGRDADGAGVRGGPLGRGTEADGVGANAVTLHDFDAGPAGRRRLATLEQLAGADLLVEHDDPVQERLGPGRATRDVDVHRDDLVDALDDRVVVEHPAATRADAHRDDPLGLDHLVVDLAEDRRHLLAHPAGHDHQIGLAGAGPEDLHPEAGEVVVRGAGRHHLDGAARESERGGEDRVPASPTDNVLQPGGEEVVRDGIEGHLRGLVLARHLVGGGDAGRDRGGAHDLSHHPTGDLAERAPVQRTHGEEIRERDDQDEEEEPHQPEAVAPELLEDGGEGIEEDDLDVEDDERERDE